MNTTTTVVEVDLIQCSRTFGAAPCTATGTQCFNSYKTCKDKPNFDQQLRTIKLCAVDQAQLLGNEDMLPVLTGDVVITPAQVKPGINIGVRGSVSLKMVDMPHNDVGFDPYVFARASGHHHSGILARLLARNETLAQRPLRVIIRAAGTITTYHYIISNVQYSSNSYTLMAVDPLEKMQQKIRLLQAKLANEIPELRPMNNRAYFSLATLRLAVEDASAIATWPTTNGLVRVGDEIFTYQSRSGVVLRDIRMTDYGSLTAKNHKVNSSIILCVRFPQANPVDVILQLINRVGLGEYVDVATWHAQRDEWLLGYFCQTIITADVSINQLLNELIEQLQIAVWFDEKTQSIAMKAIAPPLTASTVLLNTTSNGNARRFSIKHDKKGAISRVYAYYGKRDFTQANTKSTAYTDIYIAIDASSESVFGMNQQQDKIIHSRWISANAAAGMVQIAHMLLKIYQYGTKTLSVTCATSLLAGLNNADVIGIQSDQLVNADGSPQTLLAYITKMRPISVVETQVSAQVLPYFASDRIFRLVPDNYNNSYDLATAQQRITYGYLANDNGQMSDGSTGYQLVTR